MDSAKLVNQALVGGGLSYPQSVNVLIGDPKYGHDKGLLLDANVIQQRYGQNEPVAPKDDLLVNKYNNLTENNDFYLSANTSDSNIVLSDQEQYLRGKNNISVGSYDIIDGSHRNAVFGYNNIISGGLNNIVSGNPLGTYIEITEKLGESKYKTNIKSDGYTGKLILNTYIGEYHNIYLGKKVNGQFKALMPKINENFLWHRLHPSVENGYIILGSDFLNDYYKAGYNCMLLVNNIQQGSNGIEVGQHLISISSNSALFGMYNSCQNTASFLSGIGLTTYNYNEAALGRFNVSTDGGVGANKQITDTSILHKATLFSIGNGELGKNANAVEVKYNGDVYLQNIGGYNGVDYKNAKSLQSVLVETDKIINELKNQVTLLQKKVEELSKKKTT